MPEYDVCVLGTLCDNDITFAEHLCRRGLSAVVARPRSFAPAGGKAMTSLDYLTHLPHQNIHYFDNSRQFLALAKRCRLIFSHTAALPAYLGRLWKLRRFLGLPPYVNFTTGSDITELAGEDSKGGEIYRQYMVGAALNWCNPYPHAFKNILKVRPPRVVFLHYPYFMPMEHRPPTEPPLTGPLVFFHPSNLDWKVNDNTPGRNSTKGNDRFIRAFARAVASGLDARCVILDRGPDREEAKKLVAELGAQAVFDWRGPMDRDELAAAIEGCHVVVDQFDVGGFGGIAMEAMYMARPLLIFLHRVCGRLLYQGEVPVLNAYTEEEIYQTLMACRDREWLTQRGLICRQWVADNHHWAASLDQFLFYFSYLTGKQVVDYGWNLDPYSRPTKG